MTTRSDALTARPGAVWQPVVQLWTPARAHALWWAVWVATALVVAGALVVVARQWSHTQQAGQGVAALVVDAPTTPRTRPSADEAVLARLPVGDAKGVALQTLDIALGAAPSVLLVSTEFSASPRDPDRLDRTEVSFQVRGPYADVKRVLSIWMARFEVGSVLSLRIQPQPAVPGTVQASVTAALWSRPSATPRATPTAESPR